MATQELYWNPQFAGDACLRAARQVFSALVLRIQAAVATQNAYQLDQNFKAAIDILNQARQKTDSNSYKQALTEATQKVKEGWLRWLESQKQSIHRTEVNDQFIVEDPTFVDLCSYSMKNAIKQMRFQARNMRKELEDFYITEKNIAEQACPKITNPSNEKPIAQRGGISCFDLPLAAIAKNIRSLKFRWRVATQVVITRYYDRLADVIQKLFTHTINQLSYQCKGRKEIIDSLQAIQSKRQEATNVGISGRGDISYSQINDSPKDRIQFGSNILQDYVLLWDSQIEPEIEACGVTEIGRIYDTLDVFEKIEESDSFPIPLQGGFDTVVRQLEDRLRTFAAKTRELIINSQGGGSSSSSSSTSNSGTSSSVIHQKPFRQKYARVMEILVSVKTAAKYAALLDDLILTGSPNSIFEWNIAKIGQERDNIQTLVTELDSKMGSLHNKADQASQASEQEISGYKILEKQINQLTSPAPVFDNFRKQDTVRSNV